ncbi:hypothetical protein [Tabrizicola sp. BL-A-41-H6]|uniref:hypothetical protein n=1 Tax=Tabrizicola sp. BL-A-41-H6 TaxID=3421107 RepID=UPI003D670D71
MARGPISLVIVGGIALAAVAVVAGGQGLLERVLPASAMAAIGSFGLGGGSVGFAPKGTGEFASDYLFDTTDGMEARGPIAARIGNEAVFIKDVITGYTTAVGGAIPAEITTIRPILGCNPTPPKPGTAVGHVAAGRSGLDLALSTYNDTHLAAEVQTFVNVYRETGAANPSIGHGPAYEAYDVAVTERREPVYLVLEAAGGNRIWNIHQAEGVRIERVILLGGDQAGVANLDPVVPVEVILSSGLAECGVQPAYPFNEGHLFYQSVANGAISPEDAEARLGLLDAAIATYDDWFRKTFGVSSVDSRIGWDAGAMSVIGPVPGEADPKAAYAPLTGAKIRTTQDTFFEIRGQVAEGADFASRVVAIATAFAYGDIKTLRQGVEF